jgi:thiamine biosynthesis lipoprotein
VSKISPHVLVIVSLLVFTAFTRQDLPMVSISGEAQGTTYHIKYFDVKNRNLKHEIDSILNDFDRSLSLYRDDSELSIFNRSHALRFQSPYFFHVLEKSREVYKATEGIFDPTVMPLVEAYGFGPNKKRPENQNIDSLLQLIGFDKIDFDSIAVRKRQEHIRLDFNGIAQGYSVDIIGAFLQQNDINSFMVEIGGEILCKGKKNDGKPWVAGIDHPLKPGVLKASVPLINRAMTTAGNYRNHFEKNGQVFNHIINPKTGSMEQSSVFSVTVFADDAVTADGFDTAFFIMGLEKTKRFLSTRKDLDVFILYNDELGKLRSYASAGIREQVKMIQND